MSKNSKASHIHCTDCGHNSEQHKVHRAALNAIDDFFTNNFTVPRYLSINELRTSDKTLHNDLSEAHNRAIKDYNNSFDEISLPQNSGDKKGLLNNLVCSLRFYLKSDPERQNPALVLPIYMGKPFAYLGEDIGEKTNDEYRATKVQDFNRRLSDLIKNNPKLVKKNSQLEKILDTDKFKDPFDLIKDSISKNVPQHLYNGNKELLDKILDSSIFKARKHSEEALAEYMETDRFKSVLKEALMKADGIETLDKIAIDIHSTKEICKPCQTTLRWIKSYLEDIVVLILKEKEKMKNKAEFTNQEQNENMAMGEESNLKKNEVAQITVESFNNKMEGFFSTIKYPNVTKEALKKQSFKTVLTVSSQDTAKRGTNNSDRVSNHISDDAISAIQLKPDPNMAKNITNDEQSSKKYTSFINDIYKTLRNSADSINSKESQKRFTELEKQLQEANKARQESEKKAEMEAKARQESEKKAEMEAKARQELEKKLAYYEKKYGNIIEEEKEPDSKRRKIEKNEEYIPSPNPHQPHSHKIDNQKTRNQ